VLEVNKAKKVGRVLKVKQATVRVGTRTLRRRTMLTVIMVLLSTQVILAIPKAPMLTTTSAALALGVKTTGSKTLTHRR
jgi:hypothetical protein